MKTKLSLILLLAAVCRLPAQIEVIGNGNVGIGTASPGRKLEVNHDLGVTAGEKFIANFTQLGGQNGFYLGYRANGSTITSALLRADNSLPITFGTSATNEAVTILNSGNVGIGMTSPTEKLEVNGNVNLASNGQYYRTDVYSRLWTPGQSIGSVVYIGQYGPTLTYNAKYSGGWKLISGGTAGSLGMAEGRLVYSNSNAGTGGDLLTWIDRLVVEPNGNVGIGTTTPTHKLQVTGAVRATSFISDTTTYADFVFQPDYELPALSAVEAHIKERGHLPGIPSEAEAREHGMDLGAMQVKLLQKVEELTLHLIAQEKHQIAQEKQLEAQQSELRMLRTQLSSLSTQN